MANSKLQMPANYMALNESEMSCVEGGGIISQVCYAFGRMFRSTYYDKWESESKMLEQSHGAVVSKKNGVCRDSSIAESILGVCWPLGYLC